MALTKIGATLGGSADVIQVTQNSHGLTLGYPVKMTASGYAHATADSAANAEVVGIIIASTTNTLTIALGGRITVDGCVPNVTAGTVLFLQVSAGLLAATEPSSAGQISKPMAVVTVANSEMIMVQQRGEVLSTGAASIANDAIDSQHYAAASIDNEHLADGAVDTEEIADDAVTAAKLANSINTEIAANTAKVTNATHTGDVTGATALTIATDAVDIAMLSATGTASSSTFLRGDNAWAGVGGLRGSMFLSNGHPSGTGATFGGLGRGAAILFAHSSADQEVLYSGSFPSDMTTLEKAVMVCYTTGASGNLYAYFYAYSGAQAGEAWNTNSDTDSQQIIPMTQNIMTELNMASVFTNIAGGDHFQLQLYRNGNSGWDTLTDLKIYGLLFEWT